MPLSWDRGRTADLPSRPSGLATGCLGICDDVTYPALTYGPPIRFNPLPRALDGSQV